MLLLLLLSITFLWIRHIDAAFSSIAASHRQHRSLVELRIYCDELVDRTVRGGAWQSFGRVFLVRLPSHLAVTALETDCFEWRLPRCCAVRVSKCVVGWNSRGSLSVDVASYRSRFAGGRARCRTIRWEGDIELLQLLDDLGSFFRVLQRGCGRGGEWGAGGREQCATKQGKRVSRHHPPCEVSQRSHHRRSRGHAESTPRTAMHLSLAG